MVERHLGQVGTVEGRGDGAGPGAEVDGDQRPGHPCQGGDPGLDEQLRLRTWHEDPRSDREVEAVKARARAQLRYGT